MDLLLGDDRLLTLFLFLAGVFTLALVVSKRTPGFRRLHATEKDSTETRRSDAMAVSPEVEKKRDEAERMVAEGKVVEGARLLEEIGMTRHAIAILESNGCIHEACAMLVRMDRPNRAAVVYARNNYPAKAAEHFILARMFEEAAVCYLEAGKKDPAYLTEAAALFEKIDATDCALEAYGLAGKHQRVVEIALDKGKWPFLCDYISHPRNTKAVMELLEAPSLRIVGRELFNAERYRLAAQVYEQCGDWAWVAKSLARAHDFTAALKILEEQGSPLADRIRSTLASSRPEEETLSLFETIDGSEDSQSKIGKVIHIKSAS